MYTFSVHALYSVAQVAPEFEPVSPGSTYTVYVDEDTQSGESLFPGCSHIFSHWIIGEVVTNIRAREVIHETLVYSFEPWSTNHDPPWIRPGLPNPHGLTVFNQDIYRINSASGVVTAGTQAQSYIRLSVSQFYVLVASHVLYSYNYIYSNLHTIYKCLLYSAYCYG